MSDQSGGPNETSEPHGKPEAHEAQAKPDVHEAGEQPGAHAADATDLGAEPPTETEARSDSEQEAWRKAWSETPPESSFEAPEPEIHDSGAEAPPAGADSPLYGRTRTPPVIEGVATEAPHVREAGPETLSEASAETPEPETPEPKPEPETYVTAEASPPDEAPAPEALEADPWSETPPPPSAKADKPRKSPSLIAAAAAGVVALGAGGYYGWTEFVTPSEKSALIEEASELVGAKTEETQPQAAPPQETPPQEAQAQDARPQDARPQDTQPKETESSGIQPPTPAPAPVEPPKAEETTAPVPPPVAPQAEPITKAEAPSEPAPAPEAKASAAVPKIDGPKIAEPAPPEPEPAPKAVAEAPVQIAPAPAEPVKAAADPAAAEKLAQVTAQLADTQAALAQVTQRLQSVEGQLSAPKTDNRAELAARESGLSHAHDASARVVLAQSLLTALRQGDDYSSQLTGLQGFDGDSPRILSLRDGLAAPSAAKLAAAFAALAPKLAAVAAPTPQANAQDGKTPDAKPRDAKPQDGAAPRNLGATILSFLQVRVEKLVKIRPVGAPETDDETGARLKRIDADLRRGDLSAALEERARLPEPALVLSADWAKGAQARLDAELAAKAELAEALQALSKSRT